MDFSEGDFPKCSAELTTLEILPLCSKISISPPCGQSNGLLGINQNAGHAPVPFGALKQKVNRVDGLKESLFLVLILAEVYLNSLNPSL